MSNNDNLEEQPIPQKSSKKKVVKEPTLEEKVLNMAGQFNVNQISAMLGIHSHVVKEILEK